MKYIALRTEDGEKKGKIAFYCSVLGVSRQGFYQYLANRDHPWKYQVLADAMLEIVAEDACNDTYGRTRMRQALELKAPEGIAIPCERTVYRVMERLGLSHRPKRKPNAITREDREAILSNILIGNILSMCKGLGVTIENRVTVAHQLEWIPVWYKGKRMEGFKGSFQVNCCIPDLCGIGKGTARGFGTVKYKQIKGEMTDGMQRSRICRVDYQYKQVLR